MAALVFLGQTAFNLYRPLDFSFGAVIAGLFCAVGSVSVIQIVARVARPWRDYALFGIASAALFCLTCVDPIFDNSAKHYSIAIALAIWGGISGLTLAGLVAFERIGDKR